jgi:hypothetical protein
MRFSNLAGAQVTGDSTAVFIFYDLPGEPWVRVRAGGDLNRPYFGAILAKSAKNRKRLMKGKIDASMLDENRQLDRELYPKYLDGGEWGGWQEAIPNEDPDAKPEFREVPYSAEGFRELCEQLPADLFDELRGFCNEPANYRDEEDPDEDDIEALSGN